MATIPSFSKQNKDPENHRAPRRAGICIARSLRRQTRSRAVCEGHQLRVHAQERSTRGKRGHLEPRPPLRESNQIPLRETEDPGFVFRTRSVRHARPSLGNRKPEILNLDATTGGSVLPMAERKKRGSELPRLTISSVEQSTDFMQARPDKKILYPARFIVHASRLENRASCDRSAEALSQTPVVGGPNENDLHRLTSLSTVAECIGGKKKNNKTTRRPEMTCARNVVK